VARRFGRRISRHKRGKMGLLGDLLWTHRLLLGRLLRCGRRSTGYCDALRSGFRVSRWLLEIGKITGSSVPG
jgi:hypothetical protein